jgi:hypothetical protein
MKAVPTLKDAKAVMKDFERKAYERTKKTIITVKTVGMRQDLSKRIKIMNNT